MNHDAIIVMTCRKYGMPDVEIDMILTRHEAQIEARHVVDNNSVPGCFGSEVQSWLDTYTGSAAEQVRAMDSLVRYRQEKDSQSAPVVAQPSVPKAEEEIVSKIIERLRGPAPSLLAMRDGADEIERLQARVKGLETILRGNPDAFFEIRCRIANHHNMGRRTKNEIIGSTASEYVIAKDAERVALDCLRGYLNSFRLTR